MPAETIPASPAAAPTTASETPLNQLLIALPSLLTSASWSEMWGIKLSTSTNAVDAPTSIILTKFLRANNNDVEKAKAQLLRALEWRKKINPAKLLDGVESDKQTFGGLGWVTVYESEEGREVVCWNVYGAVKDNKKTFGDVEEFIRWRSALMELSVRELHISSATTPLSSTAASADPYRMTQVHDYLSVSFLRSDPAVRTASRTVIETFSMAYPELLKEKFFVNVPVLMGWFFAAMKIFLAPETVKKFHPLAYGGSLAGEVGKWGVHLPEVYGGKGKGVEEGLTVKYKGDAAVETKEGVAGAVGAPVAENKADDVD